jgi:hypothetical protein
MTTEPFGSVPSYSALVPSKISIQNITRNFSLGKFGFYCGYSEESTLEKFLRNFPIYIGNIPGKFSDIYQVNSSELLFNWTRIFRRVSEEKFLGFQGIFPRKFLVHSKLFAWRDGIKRQ